MRRGPLRRAHASHILIGSKAKAQMILDEITTSRKPFKTFKKMARDHSTCPTAEEKGDLGWFHEKQMVPTFSKQVWKQDLAQCDCFIKTQFGFHLIWVHERED
jgi:peptidyl-prolyl cis-trans isomerase C